MQINFNSSNKANLYEKLFKKISETNDKNNSETPKTHLCNKLIKMFDDVDFDDYSLTTSLGLGTVYANLVSKLNNTNQCNIYC